MRWYDGLLRIALTAAHKLLKAGWFVQRPRTLGAHALALTPERNVVLVKLRYAPGWRIPGGGRGSDETAEEAALRELREEIGMTAHGDVQLARELEESADFKRDLASLFVVRDVRYAPPRWSWEIEAITEASLDALPPDISGRAAGWLEALRDKL